MVVVGEVTPVAVAVPRVLVTVIIKAPKLVAMDALEGAGTNNVFKNTLKTNKAICWLYLF